MVKKISMTLLLILFFGWLLILVAQPIYATVIAVFSIICLAVKTMVAVWKEYLDDIT